MKTSLIIPTFNEEKSIGRLIKAILNQSELPDEIIIVDSVSKDNTVKIIKSFKSKRIKIISKKTNISQARNTAIKKARYAYILATDAGGYPDKDWVRNIKLAFDDGKVDYVMGNYKPLKARDIIKNLIGLVSLPTEKKLKKEVYFASTRSIGFKKKLWKIVGGFDESLYTGEDTKFNLEIKKFKFRAAFAQNAIVYWEPRNNLKKFIKQFYIYGVGDGKSGNIFKMLDRFFIFLAYSFVIILLFFGIFYHLLSILALVILGLLLISDSFRYSGLNLLKLPFILPFVFIKRISYFIGVLVGWLTR